MAVLQKRLRAAGLSPERVTLVSITVDPERDTREVFARYGKAFGAGRDGWLFLTESPERMRLVLKSYDEWTKQYPNGEIDHPARLHLIDARGRVREIYSLALFDERQAFFDVRALVRESGRP